MNKNEKPKRKKKKKGRAGFIVFLVAAFVLCVAVNVVLSSDKRIETMIVRTGTEEEMFEAVGFVFRKQTVIKAPAEGYVYCEVAEDQRVKSGEAVISIYKDEVNAEANSELQNIDSQIKKLSGGTLKENAYSRDDVKIEQTISMTLRDVPRLGAKGDVAAVTKIKEDVNALIEDRRIVTGEAQPGDKTQELDALKRKKAELEKQYNIERTLVHAPESGAFVSRIDGFEELLDPEHLKEIDSGYLEKLKKQKPAPDMASRVESGSSIGKIVDNFGWSVAAVVPSKLVDDVSVGDSMGIRLIDVSTVSVEGTVSQLKNEENGKTVIVVNCNKYIDSVYSTSSANMQFVKQRYEGFRVPAASIRMTDGKTGVYIIRNDMAKFVPVDILYNNKEWVIISEQAEPGERTIKLYDELIIKGKDIYNDKVVR